jgi:hypothetical protein
MAWKYVLWGTYLPNEFFTIVYFIGFGPICRRKKLGVANSGLWHQVGFRVEYVGNMLLQNVNIQLPEYAVS